MKQQSLVSRLERLKVLLRPVMIPWGRIYDAIQQADERTAEVFDKEKFIERHGSRETFVERRRKNGLQSGGIGTGR